MSIMGRYLSSKTKRKMNRLGAKYTNYADDDGGLAFDLDSLVNSLSDNYDALGKGYGSYATGNTKVAENVSAYPRVFQINGKLESGAGNVVASWEHPRPLQIRVALELACIG